MTFKRDSPPPPLWQSLLSFLMMPESLPHSHPRPVFKGIQRSIVFVSLWSRPEGGPRQGWALLRASSRAQLAGSQPACLLDFPLRTPAQKRSLAECEASVTMTQEVSQHKTNRPASRPFCSPGDDLLRCDARPVLTISSALASKLLALE